MSLCSFHIYKSIHKVWLWATRSEAERALSRNLHSRVMWETRTTRCFENTWFFFDITHGTRNVSFRLYNRYPWWTGPATPGSTYPDPPSHLLTFYFSVSSIDTNLEFQHNVSVVFKIVSSNFEPKIFLDFEIITFLVKPVFFFHLFKNFWTTKYLYFQNVIVSNERTSQDLLESL